MGAVQIPVNTTREPFIDMSNSNFSFSDFNFVKRNGADDASAKPSNNFVRNGKVYILGEFDDTISRFVIPEFPELIDAGSGQKDATIPIFINSHGGESDKLESLLSMIELARAQGIKILTINIGEAYSCGSMLACAGDLRLMSKYARNLIHLGEIGQITKTYEQLKRNNKDTKDFFDRTVKFYVEHSKMTEKQVKEILLDDMYCIGSKECLKLGLCDQII